jgi:hypothetical protein
MKPLIKFKTLQYIALLVWFALRANGQPPPGALWYNGDMNGSPDGFGLANQIGFGANDSCFREDPSQIYDDFTVPGPFAWNVTEVFSDNIIGPCTIISGVIWEIRKGVSAGNPGIVIASGFTLTPTVTPTGRVGYGVQEDGENRVTVTGLNLFLSPGQYWLSVTPFGSGGFCGTGFCEDEPFSENSVTVGADCVGTPCGNDGNAFIKSPADFWAPTTTHGSQYSDFAMGVVGTTCPVCGNMALLNGATFKPPDHQIPLPMDGQTGVEDRAAGKPGNTYTILLTFDQNIASVGRASVSCGKVASTSINGATLTINLTGVTCNASHITITVNDVLDSSGAYHLADACVAMGLLLGDVNGDAVVDSADIDIVNSELGQPTNDENFRSDINNDGVIDARDLRTVTQQQGMRLP